MTQRRVQRGQERSVMMRDAKTGRFRPKIPEPCGFDGCDRISQALGLCGSHYAQLRKGHQLRPLMKNGDWQRKRRVNPETCTFEGCDLPAKAVRLCAGHYRQFHDEVQLAPLMKNGDWQRKTHCHRGHPLSGDNIYRLSNGARVCRACSLLWQRDKRQEANRAARALAACDACGRDRDIVSMPGDIRRADERRCRECAAFEAKGVDPCHVMRYLLDDVWLQRAYVEWEWSARRIARHVGCSHNAVARYLKRAGIQIRTKSEAHRAWLAKPGVELNQRRQMVTGGVADVVGHRPLGRPRKSERQPSSAAPAGLVRPHRSAA